MRRFATALLFAAACTGLGEAAEPETDGWDEVEAVGRVLADLMEAAGRRDIDRVESFHLYGPAFSKFSETGLRRQDADAAREGERRGLAAARSFDARIEDLKVDVFDDVAVATMILRYAVTTEGMAASGATRSTIVLVRADSTWKIVHEHHSSLRGES